MPSPDRPPALPDDLLLRPIAHRGLHDPARGIVENSRAAIEAALDAGYAVEIDIQQAACGTPIVFHDEALLRLTRAPGLVRDWTAEALQAVRLAGSDESVPTLAEILALVGKRGALLVEIKDQTGALGPDIGDLEARVAELVVDHPGPVALMSFNPHSVAALAERAPSRPRGLTSCAFDDGHWDLPDYRRAELAGLVDAERVGASFVSHDHRDLDSPAVAALARQGMPILCWTIRSEEEERQARRIARNITFEGYRPAIDAT